MLSSSESAFRFFCFDSDLVDDTAVTPFTLVDCGLGVCVSVRSSWGPEGVVFGFLVVRGGLGIGAVLVLRKMFGRRGRRVDSRFPSFHLPLT